MLLRKITRAGNRAQAPIRVRCPGCLDRVTLEPAAENDAQFRAGEQSQSFAAGQRLCPNQDCRAHIFVVYDEPQSEQVTLLATYPVERIDLDTSALPENVLRALDEAATCHANSCYVASAMMVRKTLEEVCLDQQAQGTNLKERIAALGGQVVLPRALLDGLDELRLLGNDAAHVESREYLKVAQEEVEVALDVTKEILKATYQLDSIVDRLRNLKRGH
ncbi:MAG TPA: DUF4145 domain-containing protein [Thermoleophilaceae bacterium]|nr:DUF4145 domain-containing protein [Thermoleophilaceae bacterium]